MQGAVRVASFTCSPASTAIKFNASASSTNAVFALSALDNTSCAARLVPSPGPITRQLAVKSQVSAARHMISGCALSYVGTSSKNTA